MLSLHVFPDTVTGSSWILTVAATVTLFSTSKAVSLFLLTSTVTDFLFLTATVTNFLFLSTAPASPRPLPSSSPQQLQSFILVAIEILSAFVLLSPASSILLLADTKHLRVKLFPLV